MAYSKKVQRNINPTPAAVVAMYLYCQEYGDQRGGCMDFLDSLDPIRKRLCEGIAEQVVEAAAAHGQLKTRAA